MKLYLIRHGESETNVTQRHTGWGQVELTPKGEKDAARAGKALQGVTFDKVYSSDLIRAIHTQQIALPQEPGERIVLLRELGVGELTGKTVAECKELYGTAYREARAAMDYSAYGGESYAQLCARAEEFLKQLEALPYRNVAAFSHAGWIRAVLNIVTGSYQSKNLFRCDNGSISVFEYQNSTWCLKTWNYIPFS
ncbi:MAG: histidine phosphatase family protein [Clostridia bacterium]|nr:histidine phosphatase family protein [Clostridia bacterium]